ncbi:sensor histidine kinase [Christiangramia aquimixticola]|uniref:sensor histidine kinase n=1 Tax=Christiangramia aquimixticola TaxID=1697558 RepID=UPI003AA97D38
MQNNIVSNNEKLRREALKKYNIIKTGADEDYDNLTFLAAAICQVPVAMISVIGSKTIWQKSAFGTEATEIPRENSFCERIISSDNSPLIFKRSEDPEIFKAAEGVYEREYSYYAGVPLQDSHGHVIAVFSIFDLQERDLTQVQVKALKALAAQALKLFEFRKQKIKLYQVQNKLKQKYKELEKFASIVSHDLKSPLANIISLSELLKDENEGKFDEDTEQYLQFLVESSYSLRNYIDGILSFYRSEHVMDKDLSTIDLNKLLKPIVDLYQVSENIQITYPEEVILHNVNKAALTQVFMNLIGNALKYNDKEIRKVAIEFSQSEEYYYFDVKDNGNGIPEARFEEIFELFTTLETADREGNLGSGIGLATVNKLVEYMGGKINIESQEGIGSNFKFRVKRN